MRERIGPEDLFARRVAGELIGRNTVRDAHQRSQGAQALGCRELPPRHLESQRERRRERERPKREVAFVVGALAPHEPREREQSAHAVADEQPRRVRGPAARERTLGAPPAAGVHDLFERAVEVDEIALTALGRAHPVAGMVGREHVVTELGQETRELVVAGAVIAEPVQDPDVTTRG